MTDLREYTFFMNLGYAIIPKQIRINVRPAVTELRFVKDSAKEVMYKGYELISITPALPKEPPVKTGSTKELVDYLQDNLHRNSLPSEIRMIRRRPERNFWDLFFEE